jgi:hypothetical protein
MKKVTGKLFALLMVCVFAFVMFGQSTPVEAASTITKSEPVVTQPAPAVVPTENQSKVKILFSKQCCDGDNVVRCILINWTPLGDPCYCYGQGWGYAC